MSQTALITGMPQDNGLYMPEYIPDLSKVFNQEVKLTFQELSLLIAIISLSQSVFDFSKYFT